MLDIKVLRDDPQAAREAALKKRMPDRAAAVDRALELDAELRLLIPKLDATRAEQKAASKEMGKLTPAEREAFLVGQKAKKAEIQLLEEREKQLKADVEQQLALVPNIPDAEVPDGKDDTQNVEVKKHGAVLLDLDVLRVVLAIRHFGVRDVRHERELLLHIRLQLLLALFEQLDLRLLCLLPDEERFALRRRELAHLLARGLLLGARGIELGDQKAQLRIQLQRAVHRCGAVGHALFERGLTGGLWIVAENLDVEHGLPLSLRWDGRRGSLGRRSGRVTNRIALDSGAARCRSPW